MGWLTPVILLLAALGGAVVLLVTAFFSVIALAVGGLARLVLSSGAAEPEPALGKHASQPSLMGRLFKKFFFKREEQASSIGENTERSRNAERRTIPMDRGKDGIWRS